jgi:hypothetical protein
MGRAAGDGQFYRVVTQVQRQSDGSMVGLPVIRDYPSVTSILKALHVGGLDWWGHKIGVMGALDLIREGKVDVAALPEDIEAAATVLYKQVKAEKKFTPHAVLSKASGRGSNVHHIAEYIIKEGHPPSKTSVPIEQHGYVKGLWDWYQLNVQSGRILIDHSELPCWSDRHEFAGTFDVLGRIAAGVPSLDNEGALTAAEQPIIIDFKTNAKGGVYDSHHLQAAAYAAAVHEMGLCDEIPIGMVVAVGEKGNINPVIADATLDDFLAVKRVWDVVQRMSA